MACTPILPIAIANLSDIFAFGAGYYRIGAAGKGRSGLKLVALSFLQFNVCNQTRLIDGVVTLFTKVNSLCCVRVSTAGCAQYGLHAHPPHCHCKPLRHFRLWCGILQNRSRWERKERSQVSSPFFLTI